MSKRTTLTVLSFVLVLSALLLAACGDTTDPDNTPLPLENQPDGEWQLYEGAEDTICANGTPYSYYAYKGSTNNVVIDFQGGGACWNSGTCSQGSSTAGDDAFYTDSVIFYDTTGNFPGIYDHDRDDNPIKDWYHVFIPYCTGDIHIGNAEQTYTAPNGTDFTIQHNGAVNARSVLDWTFENFEDPEQIFVTGCSAGGYGAAYWTETIAENYPDADIKQLGDCAAGASSPEFSDIAEASWNPSATFPDLVFDENAVNTAYTEALTNYPDLDMAQYHSIFDEIQIGFYAAGIGEPVSPEIGAQWSQIMQTSMATIDASVAGRYSYYISALDEK